jgi:hypothetical protein
VAAIVASNERFAAAHLSALDPLIENGAQATVASFLAREQRA